MRVTTVAILVIISIACCNAQRYTLADKLNVVTDVRKVANLPEYLRADSMHVLVKLRSGVTRLEAERNGLNSVLNLRDNLLIVNVNELIGFNGSQFIEQTRPVNFLWKLSDNLTTADFTTAGEFVVFTEDPDAFMIEMRQAGLKASSVNTNLVRLEGKLSGVLSQILRKQNVGYLGKESFLPKEESTVLDLYLGPNQINRVHDEFPNLDGGGIVVSIKERHYDVYDLDLRGRHIPSNLSVHDTSSHATEMATIVAGAGNSFITGRGVAAHANVTSSSFFNLFPDSSGELLALNSSLQNHSYGTVVENFYGSLARAYDEQTYYSPKILHVFSSGNAGMSNATSGIYTAVNGFSNLTGNSKMAKNVLVVGSVDTTGNAVAFSSRGPTNDGRIKPEIVAYSSVGTSNSSALATGVAALLQQAYFEQNGVVPESALVKAILINSADDAGLPGLDFTTGFGNMNAHRSIKNLLAGNYAEGSVIQDEIKNIPLSIPPNARNLKVTLVWTDLPGNINSATPLENNLDLRLVTSTGAILPWVLNINPTVTALMAPATRGIDNINTVEQVTVENPGPEILAASVRGTSLSSASQKFYIAYQWDIDESFEWNYPTASDNFPYNGETGTYFIWKSTLASQRGDLEVSTDDGNTWKAIAKNLVLKSGRYRWSNPLPINVEARARMNVNGVMYETDDFTISKALKPSLGFNCSDSVMLQWNAQRNVLEYEVKKLDSDYASSLIVQTDTALVLQKNPTAVFYSITPMLPNGKPLLRSPSIDIEHYGAGCFISTFVDEAVTEEGILLRLELGTTYGVKQIHFERLEKNSFITIHSMSAPDRTINRFLDIDPVQGVNHYRARVLLANNQELVTDTIQNYFLTKTPFIVFPNPVTSSQDINVYSGKFETINFIFDLFNSNGAWIKSAHLLSDREFISTAGLPSGLYIYTIHGQAMNFSGKLIIK